MTTVPLYPPSLYSAAFLPASTSRVAPMAPPASFGPAVQNSAPTAPIITTAVVTDFLPHISIAGVAAVNTSIVRLESELESLTRTRG